MVEQTRSSGSAGDAQSADPNAEARLVKIWELEDKLI